MLGSIYIGLSGMDAYTKGLQTISDNVANLNTPGFKATTVSFSDIFSEGGEGQTFEGQDPSQQSGDGVRYNTPGIDFTQGTLSQSSGDLDMGIQGSGFLVLQSGDKTLYTRTGQFGVDQEGFVSLQGTKNHLLILDDANQAVAVNIDSQRTNAPVTTTKITFADNLSSTATTAAVSNVTVFDSAGGSHLWKVSFSAAGASAPGEWNVTVTDETGATIGTTVLKFNGSTVDPSTQTATINATPAGADPLSVVLDFSSGVSSFSSGTTSTIRAASVDGNAVGTLTSVTLDDTGHLIMTYSNTKTVSLGAVALADFRDPQQLERVGNGMFANTKAAEFRLVSSASSGAGTLVSHELEQSNVNLSDEFGDLILIQRGFQASSQVVSTTNDMIEELFGIRGRG